MIPSLAGVDLKLKRADEHLAFLDAEVGAFMKDGRAIVGYFDSQTSEYVFRVEGEPPSIEWGVPLSEMTHLWRSALDNLFWQLLLKRLRVEPIPGYRTVKARKPGCKPTRHKESKPSFPIHKDEGAYGGEAKSWVDKLPIEDRTFIKEAQPFKAAGPWVERHPLALLNELNNLDKHRFFQIGFGAIAGQAMDPAFGLRWVPLYEGAIAFWLFTSKYLGGSLPKGLFPFAIPVPTKDIAQTGKVLFTGGIADDRTEILRVKVVASGDDPQMDMQYVTGVVVSVSHPRIPVTLDDLFLVRGRVHEIAGQFRSLF